MEDDAFLEDGVTVSPYSLEEEAFPGDFRTQNYEFHFQAMAEAGDIQAILSKPFGSWPTRTSYSADSACSVAEGSILEKLK